MEYKITNVQERDQWDSQFGTMMTYAIALEGQEGWHSLNQKLDTPPPRVGDTITGEIQNATNKNGTQYKKFKKVNPKFAGQPSGTASNEKIDYIVKMLEELTGRRPAEDKVAPMPEEGTSEYDDPFAGLGI